MREQLSKLPLKRVTEVVLLCICVFVVLFVGLKYCSHGLNFLRLIHEPTKWLAIISGLILLFSAVLVIFKTDLKRKHERMLIKVGVWSFIIMIISFCIMTSYILVTDPPPEMNLKELIVV
ncbi:TPA: hypothetical protein ACN4VG_002323 [Staphylococcus aureus]